MMIVIINELTSEDGCWYVNVGPYCMLDGVVQSSSGIRGNRQNTETKTNTVYQILSHNLTI